MGRVPLTDDEAFELLWRELNAAPEERKLSDAEIDALIASMPDELPAL